MRCYVLVSIVMLTLTPAAMGELMVSAFDDAQIWLAGEDSYFSGWTTIAYGAVDIDEMRARLTYLANGRDGDKDGFLDGMTQVNPAGYVVLHPFSWHLNQRITLGSSYQPAIATDLVYRRGSVPMSPPPSYASGSSAIVGSSWLDDLLDYLDSTKPQAPDTPTSSWEDPPGEPAGPPVVVPEPATLAILTAGCGWLLRRRRRP